MTEELRNELQVISTRIRNLDVPHGMKQSTAITQARKEATKHLHRLGYSHRQIASVLGLKSPQSITVYLSK